MEDKLTVGKIVQLTTDERRSMSDRYLAFLRKRLEPITWVHMVREFHEKYGVPVAPHPTDIDDDTIELRNNLHNEEFNELYDAMFGAFDIVEIADAIADLIYVLIGTALCYGIPLDEVFAEVHRSNMTKDGSRREDGKILKGESFEPPRIKEILDRHSNPDAETQTETTD